ncbi:hypothetical protein [Bacillus sp. CGMCC 1.16541]|uniref:hypothetical protein n=1 Tax=Bacillus sp. CGMCC 1.16541 TaxID=2185143 RepID=UPI000D7342CF|nr:hypothetical protein [Bacillus sp. CGMCC 1.16541]
MLSEKMIEEMKRFDDAFPNGLFCYPKSVRVKVRALNEYCKARNITPQELTKEEIKRFISK